MRYNKFTTARLFIASLLGIFFMGGLIGCTREDNHIVEPEQFNNPAVSLSVSGSSALTKGGSANEVTISTSELIGEDKSGNPLYLNTKREIWSVDDIDAATKVAPSTTSTHPLQTTGIGVVVYKQENESSLAGTWTLLNPTAVGLKATYSAPTWIPSPTINWPNEGKKVHFFVYGPYSDALNSKVTFTATGATQEPRIVDFEVNTNYADQIDLLVANNITSDRTPQTLGLPMGAHNLVLSHALSAIRFKVVSGTPKVESIKVKNVYDKATYNMNTGEWTDHSTNANEYVINTPTTHTESSDPGYLYFDDVYTLMMIPSQSGGSSPLPNTASVEIKLEGSSPFVVNISSHDWLAGYSQTYIIDKNAVEPGFTYKIDAVTPTMTYQGGTSTNGKVISYRYPVGTDDSDVSARVAVSWTVEGYYPDATSAANKDYNQRLRRGLVGTFVNSFTPTVGSGSTSGESLTLSYQAAVVSNVTTNRPGDAYDAAIAAAPKVGTTTPYNLAGYVVNTDGTITNPNADNTTIMNTANTYIINGAGYYRFPIVMGNGVKNGSLNPEAYPSNFRDYLDREITSPFLNATGDEQPTDVYVSWMDWDFITVVDKNSVVYGVPGNDISTYFLTNEGSPSTQTITNGISEIDGNYWVNLHVPTATKQGVAQLSVRDAKGRVMWSWLIWLTDYNLMTGEGVGEHSKNVKVRPLKRIDIDEGTGALITVMPRNLGFVEKGFIKSSIYSAATPVYVRLEQSESGQTKILALTRPEKTIEDAQVGYNPYYQFGRPFPQRPGNGKDDSEPSGYGGFYPPSATRTTVMGPISLGSSIQKADFFIQSQNTWVDSYHLNLWDATNVTNYTAFQYEDMKDVVKSIYDPSPVGYKVPRFMTFTTNIQNDTKYLNTYNYMRGKLNGYPHNANNIVGRLGLYMYVNHYNSTETPGGETLYFPLVGIRNHTSGLMYRMFHHGAVWTAAPNGSLFGRNAYFLSDLNQTAPQNADFRAFGMSVRPVKEE